MFFKHSMLWNCKNELSYELNQMTIRSTLILKKNNNSIKRIIVFKAKKKKKIRLNL